MYRYSVVDGYLNTKEGIAGSTVRLWKYIFDNSIGTNSCVDLLGPWPNGNFRIDKPLDGLTPF